MTNIVTRKMSLDGDVPVEVLLHYVCEYLGSKQDLISFSSASSTLRKMMFSSSALTLWNRLLGTDPFEICIDGYCPTCHHWKSRGGVQSALRFMSKCPLRSLSLHCFLTDLPSCLFALLDARHLESLTLRLTNTSNSPPLDCLLQDSGIFQQLQPDSFANLQELVVNSSHLHHVKLAGRARLLDIMGKNLISLKFMNLSPTGVFSILSNRCPKLTSLRVDKASIPADLEAYRNNHLQELELCRLNFIPVKLSFSALRKVKCSTVFRMEEFQLKTLIAALPKTLISLNLEIPGSYTNQTLLIVSKYLPNLKCLILEGSYEKGVVTRVALEQVQQKMIALETFELISTKSVTTLTFDSMESFLILRNFQSLKILRIIFDEVIMLGLLDLLQDNDHLETLYITAKQRWIPTHIYEATKQFLVNTQKKFPNIIFVLETS